MKDLKKENIENLSYKDITYLILEKEKQGINTLDLFTRIIKLLELPDSMINTKIADFYTSLTTDKRFLLVDGLWDLRNRHTSDKILTSIDEEEDEESEENLEEMDEENLDDMDNNDYSEDDLDDDTSYDDDDDDLSDLAILSEDEMDMDNEQRLS